MQCAAIANGVTGNDEFHQIIDVNSLKMENETFKLDYTGANDDIECL